MQILYFAWVREGVGIGEEQVDPPVEVTTVSELIDWLGYDVLADKSKLRAAVDQLFVPLDAPIASAREVAIFPPVTGRMIRVLVTDAAIDVAGEMASLEAVGGGAVATFTGVVRDDGGVSELFLEHYPGATEASLEKLAEEAVKRWSLAGVVVIHRVGAMTPGERIVFVGTSAPHRAAALEACAFLIDRLKTDAPFWKRETRREGANWVGERSSDHEAADKWR